MAPDGCVVRVLPDVAGLDKVFDYSVPARLRDDVRVGTLVRIDLHGRRVGGWVLEVGAEATAGVVLKPIAKVTGWGPPADVVDLAGWAAWRWAGRRASLLRTASPPTAVTALPGPAPGHAPGQAPGAAQGAGGDGGAAFARGPGPEDELVRAALSGATTVVRLSPGADRFPLVAAAAGRGHALVLTPSLDEAARLAAGLRRAGVAVALAPGQWVRAAAGATVVGARAAAWAPVPDLAAVVVLDEHDEAYKEERAPAWHARDVAVERARRGGAPCVLVSPCPSLEALAWAGGDRVLAPVPAQERAGWPVLEVVDRRGEDPVRASLYSARLVALLRDRDRGRALCVLNRTGRSRLLACGRCGELARCEACTAAVAQPVPGVLRCRRCARERPVVCPGCGSSTTRNLRAGVSRVREELEALVGEEVGELTATTAPDDPARRCRVVVGTEAVLHARGPASGGPAGAGSAGAGTGRGATVGVIAFLDLDQELAAPRSRADEEALALLARAARLLGGRRRDGRLLVQTRLPRHPVVLAALHGDPARVSDDDRARREALGFPPAVAMAAVSGAGAAAYVEALAAHGGRAPDGGAGREGGGPSGGPRTTAAPPSPAAAANARATRALSTKASQTWRSGGGS